MARKRKLPVSAIIDLTDEPPPSAPHYSPPDGLPDARPAKHGRHRNAPEAGAESFQPIVLDDDPGTPDFTLPQMHSLPLDLTGSDQGMQMTGMAGPSMRMPTVQPNRYQFTDVTQFLPDMNTPHGRMAGYPPIQSVNSHVPHQLQYPHVNYQSDPVFGSYPPGQYAFGHPQIPFAYNQMTPSMAGGQYPPNALEMASPGLRIPNPPQPGPVHRPVPTSSSSWSLETIRKCVRLPTRMVGCNHYNHPVKLDEYVVLQRDPKNIFDKNCIQVSSLAGIQIGSVPRQIAAVLAPFLDRNRTRLIGVVTGRKGLYECPIDIIIDGDGPPASELRKLMDVSGRTPKYKFKEQGDYIQPSGRHVPGVSSFSSFVASGMADANPTLGESFETAYGEGGEPGSMVSELVGSATPGGGLPTNPISNMMRDLIENREKVQSRPIDDLEQFGTSIKDLENMPKAAQPKTVKTTLLPYQLQGLDWLLSKEHPAVPKGKKHTQLWLRHGKSAFRHMVSGRYLNETPFLARGGILADDMGLGKTLQAISLIAADRSIHLSSAAAGTPTTTLIISPLGVMSVWSSQIKHHVHESDKMKVLIYHGPKKAELTPTVASNYDVIITTYETVMSEWMAAPEEDRVVDRFRPTGLFSVEWRRIILDEGHTIRNSKTKKNNAACRLQAWSRWVLTGTPIVNSLSDLGSLVTFLRLSGGIEQSNVFSAAVARPVAAGRSDGLKILQGLMHDICLRRVKSMPFIDLKLPPVTEFIHRIKFTPGEQEKYDVLEDEARGRLAEYVEKVRDKTRPGEEDSDSAAASYRKVLEVLLRLRQVCNHWKLCGESRLSGIMEIIAENKMVERKEPDVEVLREMLQLAVQDDEPCTLCRSTFREPVIAICGHPFCNSCVVRELEMKKKCPTCDAPMTEKDLVQPDEKANSIDAIEGSSKVEATIAIIMHMMDNNKHNKTVLFSQWTKFLDIVQLRFVQIGIKFTRIDGSMSMSERDQAVTQLDTDPECNVLLASLAVCSVGLNLVSANQVILADTWWAPAIEDQAVDRVHRLGQTKECTVYRLVVDRTVEEKVMAVQESKRELMRLALSDQTNGRTRKEQRVTRLADIEKLLGVRRSSRSPPRTLGTSIGSAHPVEAVQQPRLDVGDQKRIVEMADEIPGAHTAKQELNTAPPETGHLPLAASFPSWPVPPGPVTPVSSRTTRSMPASKTSTLSTPLSAITGPRFVDPLQTFHRLMSSAESTEVKADPTVKTDPTVNIDPTVKIDPVVDPSYDSTPTPVVKKDPWLDQEPVANPDFAPVRSTPVKHEPEISINHLDLPVFVPKLEATADQDSVDVNGGSEILSKSTNLDSSATNDDEIAS